MRAVYVDTSALLPLVDRNDADHDRVTAALRALRGSRTGLVTTSYTLVEAGALVRRRIGMDALRALGGAIGSFREVVWVDEPLHCRAWAEVARGGRTGPGLVDWAGFLAMRDRGLDQALAIDAHFVEQGFRTLP